MSYGDEYYNRTPEQKHAIYKERARSLNVLRFGAALFLFFGVLALFDYWSRNFVEPAAHNLTAPASEQTMVRLDGSFLFLPVLVGGLFVVAVLVRTMGREDQEVQETDPKHSRRAAVQQDHAKAKPVPTQKTAKNSKTTDDSTSIDEWTREWNERKARQKEKASALAMIRKQKYEAQDRVRAAQADRAIANAISTFQPKIGGRIGTEKLVKEQFGQDHVEIK